MEAFLMLSSLLLIPIVSFYVLQLLNHSRRRCRLPPGPTSLQLISNLFDIAKTSIPAHQSLARLARRHGPLMTLRIGTTVIVVASSPSAAREVLRTHNGSLTGRSPPDTWLALGHASNSVFVLPPRHKWRALRRIGAEHALSARQLDGGRLRPMLRDAVLGLVRRVSGQLAQPVEVGRFAFEAAMDLQWRVMFSAGLLDNGDDDVAARDELYDAAREAVALSLKPNVSDLFPALAAVDLQGVRRRFAKRLAVVYRMIDEQIERRTVDGWGGGSPSDDKKQHDDLLDVLLGMSKRGTDDQGLVTINRDFMRTFLADMFLATMDTISGTVEWAMAELLQHPDTLRKLQEELSSVLTSKATHVVEHCDLDRLPYLQAVIRETLRLHPVIPLVPNKAEETVDINGYAVPKGCTVLVNIWAVHRDPGAWPEPEKFAPERFLQRLEDAAGFVGNADFDFIPFSAGRRACLGLPLAARMVPAMLGSLVHRFEWTLPQEVVESGGLDMAEKAGLTMTMATPLQAIAKKRNE